jgi:alkanesulfonate monooxygenase SsuD/methylene tetrahydromethanopterin reductase-like flavin-dependent oxidoreductase (luciferase family)
MLILRGDVMAERTVLFGAGLGAWNGADVGAVAETVMLAQLADSLDLDLFSVADHPYFADRLDAWATLAFLLGHTTRIGGVVTVTNLPSRPAPMVARAASSLSVLSGRRIVLGLGAGFLWDEIVKLGVPRLEPGAAVDALAEAITLIRALTGGGEPVTFDGACYRVSGVVPAAEPAPPIWTGSVHPKSLAVTGRLADGWVPSRGSDWLSPLYRQSRPIIDKAADAAGRDPAAVATVYNFGGRITPEPLPATRDDDGRWIGGSAGQWIEELTGAVLEHQAGGFFYRGTDDTPPAAALQRWAEEVVPAVRAAVASG